jgi:hypothetical protein
MNTNAQTVIYIYIYREQNFLTSLLDVNDIEGFF